MSDNFEWRTEEDDWPVGEPPPSAAQKKRSLPWSWFLIPLFILIIGGLYLRLNQRVEQVDQSLATAILATHQLVEQAALNEDLELFSTLLAPVWPGWRERQVVLFRHHHFWERPGLGLTIRDAEIATPTVTLSPDLERAEVLSQQPFYFQGANGRWQETLLERTTFYRRQENEWLFGPAPRGESYWGEWQTSRLSPLVITYPAIDQATISSLAPRLAALTMDLCTRPSIACPANFRLELFFDTSSNSLRNLNTNYRTRQLSGGYEPYHIILPTPTLVGRPLDETGQQALYQGYASWLAAILVHRYQERQAGQTVSEQLARWQLHPPPMPEPPGFPLGPRLPDSYLFPPLPLAQQTLTLICPHYQPRQALFYHPATNTWREAPPAALTDRLAQLQMLEQRTSRLSNPGQSFLLRRPLAGPPSGSQILLWLGGLDQLLTVEQGPRIFLSEPPQIEGDPNGRYLPLYPYSSDSQTPIEQTYLLDLPACLDGSCQLSEVAGRPTWSPNGQQTALVEPGADEQSLLHLGEANGQISDTLGAGYSPHWLNEQTLLYIRPATQIDRFDRPAAGSEVVLTQLATQPLSPTVILNSTDLLQLFPSRVPGTYLLIHDVISRPGQIGQWYLGATLHELGQPPRHLLFLFERSEERLQLLWEGRGQALAWPLVVSDDGRYLTALTFVPDSTSNWDLLIFDLDDLDNPAATPIRYPTTSAYFDWSADGQWLLLAEEGAFHFIAPAHDYSYALSHGLECDTIGWTPE